MNVSPAIVNVPIRGLPLVLASNENWINAFPEPLPLPGAMDIQGASLAAVQVPVAVSDTLSLPAALLVLIEVVPSDAPLLLVNGHWSIHTSNASRVTLWLTIGAVIVNVWFPHARPCCSQTACCSRSVEPVRDTLPSVTPSSEIEALPCAGPVQLIQRTPEPLKLSSAVSCASVVNAYSLVLAGAEVTSCQAP